MKLPKLSYGTDQRVINSVPADTPYRRLWLSVLLQAVADTRLGTLPDTPKNKSYNERINTIRIDAAYWFCATNSDVGSFIWICQLFNMDPERIRNKIRTLPSVRKLQDNYRVNSDKQVPR